MNKRLVPWLASGIVAFTLAFTGCGKKEEPAPAPIPAPAVAPAGSTDTGAGAVAPGQAGSDAGPASSAATGETKKPDKQEAGTKKN
jgi:hypothetical protein